MKSISDYLPKKAQKILIQAHIDEDLVEEAKLIMESLDLSWSRLFTACLQKFIDEQKEKLK